MTAAAPAAKKRMRVSPLAILLVGLVAIVAIVAMLVMKPKDKFEPYKTQQVTRGAITKSVSSSGTLQALVTVDVGSQVSGQLSEVLVDFDDKVTEGQVLARINPETQQARLDSAKAELQSSEESVNSARANLSQAQANLQVAQADYNRTKSLYDSGIVAKAALEQADAKLASTKAQVQVSQASIKSAQARLQQSTQSVRTNQIDLGRTIITSPITGVVVDRKVDKGSTVAASLNAPVLFKIAQDLSKLELKILVDEADIGQVRVGQTVNFTVDAFPQDRFEAEITQVRKQPETQSNVVAYVVMARADNPDLKLLPGMTTNAEIMLERHTNVLRVPSGALRWQPAEYSPPQAAGRGGPPGFGGGFGGPPGGRGGFGGRGGPGGGRGGPGGGGGAGRGGNPWSAFDQLDLNDQQLIKLNALIDEQRKEVLKVQVKMQKEMARSGTVDRQVFQREMQESQRKYRDQAQAMLTPAQKTKLQQIQSGQVRSPWQRGQVYVLRDGKPFRIGVGVGVTDGQNTQVISNSFKQGDMVIVSGGPEPAAAGRGGR